MQGHALTVDQNLARCGSRVGWQLYNVAKSRSSVGLSATGVCQQRLGAHCTTGGVLGSVVGSWWRRRIVVAAFADCGEGENEACGDGNTSQSCTAGRPAHRSRLSARDKLRTPRHYFSLTFPLSVSLPLSLYLSATWTADLRLLPRPRPCPPFVWSLARGSLPLCIATEAGEPWRLQQSSPPRRHRVLYSQPPRRRNLRAAMTPYRRAP